MESVSVEKKAAAMSNALKLVATILPEMDEAEGYSSKGKDPSPKPNPKPNTNTSTNPNPPKTKKRKRSTAWTASSGLAFGK